MGHESGQNMEIGLLHLVGQGQFLKILPKHWDQKIIAGLGNIYVCEALHRARLSPRRKAGTLARGRRVDPRLEELARHIREILLEAIEAGGSTLRDFAHADGSSGDFQERFLVYDREGEPCRNCGAPVRRIVQFGRSTFYCKTCQR